MMSVVRADRAARHEGWHIWLVTDVYPPDCGGSGWSAHALAQTLKDRGHHVEVIAVAPTVSGLRERTFEDIGVTEVGVRGARRSPRRRFGARDYSYTVLRDYLCARLTETPRVDILHAQHLHSGPPTLSAARQHSRGAVLTLRDYWPVCLHGTSWWQERACSGCSSENLVGCMAEYWRWPSPLGRVMVPWARRRLAARRIGVAGAHQVLAVSEAVRQRVQPELSDVPVQVLPNIVDPEQAEADAARGAAAVGEIGSPYLLTAGKLVPSKGFERLLVALRDAGLRWPLLIAGSGPERTALERRAESLHLPVRFLGWVEHASLLALIQKALAFLLPSAWDEPLSRLMLESMALGTPVVAWAVGGSGEAIKSGENSWLVTRPADLEVALADLRNESSRHRVGSAARRWAEHRYSPEAVYPRLQSIYAAAITSAESNRAPANGASARKS